MTYDSSHTRVTQRTRYLFYWYLMQDGRIEFEIKLSGELSTNLVSDGESETMPDHGVIVAPGVNAQIHQVRGGGGNRRFDSSRILWNLFDLSGRTYPAGGLFPLLAAVGGGKHPRVTLNNNWCFCLP